ncbi:MAG: NnrS family protein [Gallionella sp.]
MLSNFTAAPHRVMFFGGALQSIAAMLWWLIELVTRDGVLGPVLRWPIPPFAAHAYLMIYGLFPFFMFGFLLTVFPRWMNGREIAKPYYLTSFALLMLGVFVFYMGLWVSPTLLIVSTLSTLAGWGVALYALLRVLLDVPHPDKKHPIIIFIALSVGWSGVALYSIWLLNSNLLLLDFAIQGGIWLFLLPLFASVAHRMIPFFTRSAQPSHVMTRPVWPWWILLMASVVHCVLQLTNESAWLWLADMPLTIAIFYLSYAWGSHQCLRKPLLGVLHIGFAWIGVAMLLFSIQSLMLLYDATVVWGFAPLHALCIGGFTTLLMGMVTRVTLGHAGLPKQLDLPVNMMFAGIQVVALLRVLADMLPMPVRNGLYVAAVVVWLLCFTAWMLRYLPVYWQARADGRAG